MEKKDENVILWILGILAVVALTGGAAVVINVKSKSEYKKRISDIARALGIPAAPLLAQSALESNWGQSGLTRQANNLFGFTAGQDFLQASQGKIPWSQVPSWSVLGPAVIKMPTREYSKTPPEKIQYWDGPGDIIEKKSDGKGGSILMVNRAFRKYADWTESVKDWFNKISTMPRYKEAFEALKRGDVAAFAAAAKAGGYATDPEYVQKIITTASVVNATPEAVA